MIELTQILNMIFNISLGMLHNREDAEDATQEIFIKVHNNYKNFRGESKVETWIYRIAYNYLINYKNRMQGLSFELFEKDLENFEPYKNEFNLTKVEEKIFVEEIKVGCTTAMLQCLDPENRYVFIVGEIFGFNSKNGAEVCNVSEDLFRQRLSRGRKKLKNFMNKNCGLVNKNATCKCRKRIKIAYDNKRISFEKSLYQTDSKKIRNYISELNELDSISKVFLDNPFIDVKELFKTNIAKTYRILSD